MSSVVADVPVIDLAEEDLEDGEIDDDEEEEEEQQQAKPQQQQQQLHLPSPAEEDVQFMGILEVKNKLADEDVVFMGLPPPCGDTGGQQQSQQQHNNNSGGKSKKPRPLEGRESSSGIITTHFSQIRILRPSLFLACSLPPRLRLDDHASSIENAIANALKKKGIEPPMPRMRSLNQDLGDGPMEGLGMGSGSGEASTGGSQLQPSRSSRRRKRKKEREREQKKDKDNSQVRLPQNLSTFNDF